MGWKEHKEFVKAYFNEVSHKFYGNPVERNKITTETQYDLRGPLQEALQGKDNKGDFYRLTYEIHDIKNQPGCMLCPMYNPFKDMREDRNGLVPKNHPDYYCMLDIAEIMDSVCESTKRSKNALCLQSGTSQIKKDDEYDINEENFIF